METEDSMINVFMDLPNIEEDVETGGGGEIQEDDADYEYYYDDEGSGEVASDDGDLQSRGYSSAAAASRLGGRGRARQPWAPQAA